MKNYLNRWLPLVLSMAIVFIFSMDHNPYRLLPIKRHESSLEEEQFGVMGHILEFALLGLTAARALIWDRKSSKKLYRSIFAGCVLYALSDEIHQIFVPGRTFQVQDLILDCVGIIFGLLIYHSMRQSRSRKK